MGFVFIMAMMGWVIMIVPPTLGRDLGEHVDQEDVTELFKQFDVNSSGQVDFEEFVEGIFNYLQENNHLLRSVQVNS